MGARPPCLPSRATTCKSTLNVAKVKRKLRVAYAINICWYGSMKWNMEWKIFSMEWKWNRRKLPVWNIEKSFSIPFSYRALTISKGGAFVFLRSHPFSLLSC